ncbi:hypothetical protein [Geothrix edaphica]|uniref:Site-specific DNA-methyltransferase (adenine-specific) n=1 Tax=Geothrix edaphica TaxID=2927976 RepID=A0ABQ5PUL6_9BACT|nr:hypothetical protein [Geothrix edaphica]GLH65820.1 hypothetical protein GETHED_01840 [Geothrix edaphica]
MTTPMRHREETVNTYLAQAISQLGVQAEAEVILAKGKDRPDVLFTLRGLRIAIEGKFADTPGAKDLVFQDAKGRVRHGIAHIAAAAVYPADLRTAPTQQLAKRLQDASLEFCIVTETTSPTWAKGSPEELMAALRRAQETLSQDDLVEQTATSLGARLDGVAALWSGQPDVCDRLSDLLGIHPPEDEKPEDRERRRVTAAKVAALALSNALIFEEQLAGSRTGIKTLGQVQRSKTPIQDVADHWQWIWENINYVPIFQLGERILREVPNSRNASVAFKALLKEAASICEKQTALRHDLMGRIYHWLLHQAKFLGTYYTSVSAATLLLKLATDIPGDDRDYADLRVLEDLRIADLTCGTGTLLMAAAQALADKHIRARAEQGLPIHPPDLQGFHRALMERILHGYDVLPSALHLTASTLALLAPEVAFTRMNLFVMPMGVGDGQSGIRLGSLDFIGRNTIPTEVTLDGARMDAKQVSAAHVSTSSATLPDLDLCVMNPPFVRSVGGNLLFGSLPQAEREVLQKELKKRSKRLSANITAGLGSVFVAVAEKRLKPKGRMAFVLPAALISGEAWAATRELLATCHHLEMVITSHDAGRPNFSENTDLSEVMFITRKKDGLYETPGRTQYLNLWRNPTSIYEALDLAHHVLATPPANVEGTGTQAIRTPQGKLGELMSMPAPRGSENWTGGLFSQTELARTFWHLGNGLVQVPGQATPISVTLCPLAALGDLGPDQRRIHDGFYPSTEEFSPYRGVWNHDSQAITTIRQEPNTFLVVKQDSPRGPNYGAHLWERSGDILLVERLRTNSQRVLAIGLDESVLANTWWPLRSNFDPNRRKAMLLWLNGSLALLLFYGRRVVTQGAWMKMKQPAWEGMPVLDVRVLSDAQAMALAGAYDRLGAQKLMALSKLEEDPVRAEIDEAISKALGMPNLNPLRKLMAREPGLTDHGIGSPVGEAQPFAEDDDPQNPEPIALL